MTVCPFCLTIFMFGQAEGCECPDCEIGTLENYYEYLEKIEKLEKENDADEEH